MLSPQLACPCIKYNPLARACGVNISLHCFQNVLLFQSTMPIKPNIKGLWFSSSTSWQRCTSIGTGCCSVASGNMRPQWGKSPSCCWNETWGDNPLARSIWGNSMLPVQSMEASPPAIRPSGTPHISYYESRHCWQILKRRMKHYKYFSVWARIVWEGVRWTFMTP